MKKLIVIALALFCFCLNAQTQNTGKPLTKEEMAAYEKEIGLMINYLEETMNFIGEGTSTAQEKEIIFTQSYNKIFSDDKVQIEDDLDDKRTTPINKDVQAYLKDIDFFFKKATFEFAIQNIANYQTDDGKTFFKVTLTRKLTGETINADSVNNVKTRYIEINYDRQNNDMKIASIYTTKLNEKEELKNWWNNMTDGWRSYLAKGIVVYDSIPLDSVSRINANNFIAAYPSVRIYGKDTVVQWNHSTFDTDMNPLYSTLRSLTQIQNVDVSDMSNIYNLDPLSELSNLTTLDISGTKVRDMAPLRNANKMKILKANRTRINDLSPLKYNIELRELEVAETQVKDLDGIEALSNLEKLDISKTQVQDIALLRNFRNLSHFAASGSKITNLEPLTDLGNLSYIDISNTNVMGLAPIEKLKSLQSINISSTPIDNLYSLENLEGLKELFFSNTSINDLSPLKNHKRLSKIYCDNSGIKVAEASEFAKDRPYTLVIYDTEALKTWWEGLPIYWKAVFQKQNNLDSEPNTEQLHAIINMKELNLSGNKYLQNLLPVSRLTNLETLDISNTEIIRLDPLNGMPNLHTINMENTYVATLQGLANLYNLKFLNINATPIDDLETLSKLTKLETVLADNSNITNEQVIALKEKQPQVTVIYQTNDLQSWWGNLEYGWKEILKNHIPYNTANPNGLELQKMVDLKDITIDPSISIQTLEPLSKFFWIETLKANNQSIRDLSPLSNKQHLRELEIQSNPITSLEPIQMDILLEVLNVENTQISDLSSIEKMQNLRILNASGTGIKSLKPLANLTKLENLSIYNTNVKNISPIENITTLKSLKVYNTKVRSKSIEELQQKRFDINIVYY
jgi:Leucine Rich Repeat.